ncbi:DUF1850 domain-containing protein [Roseicitreum antarcticum]|uniref:DUF1850 domain-containing protein n=1 Tax=Roseicitreum antarcticum TaxID=564137 RepID=A0A1H3BN69_9RHOB|nr:DUF1850 domain-containing protein [Roseicitreum antarcticum]SDX43450.1 hypothetical protein SAMN04488238_108122 [Roseicitreum antarcticum]
MRHVASGRPCGVALSFGIALAVISLPAQADTLQITGADGESLAAMPFPQGVEICLRWSHSVTLGAVADCFENRSGALTLMRSYLHDFAAGLGEVAGRGTLTSAPDGGYWITGMDEALPANSLALRVGPARVGHRIDHPGGTLDLSAIAANTRVTLTLSSDQDSP